jgi:hypothetical protein
MLVGIFYFMYWRTQTENSRREALMASANFARLLEFCDHKAEGVVECKVFLEDFVELDDGRECLEITLPTPELLERQTRLCLEKGTINWENPYEDYSLQVPVLMRISDPRSLSRVNDVRINVLEDDIADELLSKINTPNSKHIFIWTRELINYRERGYDILGEEDGGGKIVPIGVSIREANIISYRTQNGEIELEIQAFLDGMDARFFLRSESFYLLDILLEEEVLISSENVERVDTNLNYSVSLALRDKSLFSEDYVKEQVSLLISDRESDFLLKDVGVIYE